MNTINSNPSFIPKQSFTNEESFLERPRPRSFLLFITIIIFLSSSGSYIALYLYNRSLLKDIGAKTFEIEKVQKQFKDSKEVSEAKIFSARAALAQDVLSSHTTISPVLSFLSENTLGPIFYENFSIENIDNLLTVELVGESPSYAVLAYQGDLLRTKTTELSDFSIKNVTLTKSGTISFNLSLIFKEKYLLYSENLQKENNLLSLKEKNKIVPSKNTSTDTVVEPVIDVSTKTPATQPKESQQENKTSLSPKSPTKGDVVKNQTTVNKFLLWFKFW